jgi:SAM-dependent methyltransferase
VLTRALSAFNRRLLRRRLPSYAAARPLIAGKRGVEVGGPSDFFSRHGEFPIYAAAAAIDNCNFSAQTIWAGAAPPGQNFVYDAQHAPGWQYISEAAELSEIASATYDFVLASHTLEHLANPLRALNEWKRVVALHGVFVIVVPDRQRTFDHRRPVTTMAHLVEDFERQTGEDDLTHLPEILQLHDLTRDPQAGDFAAFKARSEQNVMNRCLHHHVFDRDLIGEALKWSGLRVLALDLAKPYHIIAIAQKS